MGGHKFWKTSLAGEHVFWEVMYYGRTCLTVKHHEVRNVLNDDMSCKVLVKYNHFFFFPIAH